MTTSEHKPYAWYAANETITEQTRRLADPFEPHDILVVQTPQVPSSEICDSFSYAASRLHELPEFVQEAKLPPLELVQKPPLVVCFFNIDPHPVLDGIIVLGRHPKASVNHYRRARDIGKAFTNSWLSAENLPQIPPIPEQRSFFSFRP